MLIFSFSRQSYEKLSAEQKEFILFFMPKRSNFAPLERKDTKKREESQIYLRFSECIVSSAKLK
jgi:hypothetical protein